MGSDAYVSEPIRVVVADDHPLFRDGVMNSLQATGSIQVVGQAEDADGAVRVVRDLLPDLVLLDVTMPGGGISAARKHRSRVPRDAYRDADRLRARGRSAGGDEGGASGYVLKGVSARQLASVVRSVSAGEVYVAPRWPGGCCARCRPGTRAIRLPS